MVGKRVVVVQATPYLSWIISKTLRNNGAIAVDLVCPQAALLVHSPDLYLVDYFLGDGQMSGPEFVRAVSRPVIGTGRPDQREEFIRAGAREFLEKPKGVKDLVPKIRQALYQKI